MLAMLHNVSFEQIMDMDLSKVKLVVTDMDGTLLNSKGQVSSKFLSLFEQLKNLDLTFVAASGRQYHSIVDKLHMIKDDIVIIAENGGVTKKQESTLQHNYFPKEDVFNLIKLLRNVENIYPVICGETKAYIETKDQKFINLLNEYYSAYELVDDLTAVENDNFFKIAIYHFDSSEAYIYPHVKHLNGNIQVKISGKHWVDLSHINTHKGFALKKLQEQLQVSDAETMVFGDYNNDLEMLELAHFSYAMENAHPNVKAVAKYKTKSNDEEGVEYILEQLINEKSISKSR